MSYRGVDSLQRSGKDVRNSVRALLAVAIDVLSEGGETAISVSRAISAHQADHDELRCFLFWSHATEFEMPIPRALPCGPPRSL